jgi:acyl-CoA synthetase (AMP-forming)/AMP-acid ligase II
LERQLGAPLMAILIGSWSLTSHRCSPRAPSGRRTRPRSARRGELTYGELEDRSARLAGLLREKGIEVGDRVGVMLPNVPDFPVAYYGVLRAGAIVCR